MSVFNWMIVGFDAVIARIIRGKIDQRAREFNEDQTSKKFYEASDSIDVKSTAVLQHVSIMIGVSSILFSQTENHYFKAFFALEVISYMFLAVACLRQFMSQYIFPSLGETKNIVAKEDLLDITAKLAFFVSVILVLTIIAETGSHFFLETKK